MSEIDVNKIDRQDWLNAVFPEWGTYLNEEIESEVVQPGKLAFWWLGVCGIWMKTPQNTNITIDFWAQRGVSTKQFPTDRVRIGWSDHGFVRQSGLRGQAGTLRSSPHVIDPFAVKTMDALLSTHIHGDHICRFVAASTLKNTNAMFIGPKECGNMWAIWGVPENRIHRMELGETYKVKDDVEITALESFDRTALLGAHPEPKGDIRGRPDLIPDMNERSFNYLIKTPSGTMYHSGDSHFANMYLKHGRDHKIDVTFVSYGDPQIGQTDKMSCEDVLKTGWSLNTKVMIPIHWDMWSSQIPDPHLLDYMHQFYKRRLKKEGYNFKLVIWKIGGKFIWPDDQDIEWYTYPKMTENFDPNRAVMFYPSFL